MTVSYTVHEYWLSVCFAFRVRFWSIHVYLRRKRVFRVRVSRRNYFAPELYPVGAGPGQNRFSKVDVWAVVAECTGTWATRSG